MVWSYQVVHHDLWDYDVARSRPHRVRRASRRRRHHQDGPPVRARPPHGQPSTGGRARRAEERYPWRGCRANPAGPHRSSAWCRKGSRTPICGATDADRRPAAKLSKLRNEGRTPAEFCGQIAFRGTPAASTGAARRGSGARPLFSDTNRMAAIFRLDSARPTVGGEGEDEGRQRALLRRVCAPERHAVRDVSHVAGRAQRAALQRPPWARWWRST